MTASPKPRAPTECVDASALSAYAESLNCADFATRLSAPARAARGRRLQIVLRCAQIGDGAARLVDRNEIIAAVERRARFLHAPLVFADRSGGGSDRLRRDLTALGALHLRARRVERG